MLKFEFWSIFEAVANIIILFILLRIFLFKPINKMIHANKVNLSKVNTTRNAPINITNNVKQHFSNVLFVYSFPSFFRIFVPSDMISTGFTDSWLMTGVTTNKRENRRE